MARINAAAQVVVDVNTEDLNILTAFMQPGGFLMFEAVVRHMGCEVYSYADDGGRFVDAARSARRFATMGDALIYSALLCDFDSALIARVGFERSDEIADIGPFSDELSQWRRDVSFFNYVDEGSDSVTEWARSIAGERCSAPYDVERQMSVKWTRWEDLRHALRLSSRLIVVEGLRKHIAHYAPETLELCDPAESADPTDFLGGISDPTPEQFAEAYIAYQARLQS